MPTRISARAKPVSSKYEISSSTTIPDILADLAETKTRFESVVDEMEILSRKIVSIENQLNEKQYSTFIKSAPPSSKIIRDVIVKNERAMSKDQQPSSTFVNSVSPSSKIIRDVIIPPYSAFLKSTDREFIDKALMTNNSRKVCFQSSLPSNFLNVTMGYQKVPINAGITKGILVGKKTPSSINHDCKKEVNIKGINIVYEKVDGYLNNVKYESSSSILPCPNQSGTDKRQVNIPFPVADSRSFVREGGRPTNEIYHHNKRPAPLPPSHVRIKTTKKKKLPLPINTEIAAPLSGGDPPWRTVGHTYLGLKILYPTPMQILKSMKNKDIDETPDSVVNRTHSKGIVAGWISSKDVDSDGLPGFESTRTGKPIPAELFHVVFDAFSILDFQDLEEYELMACLLERSGLGLKQSLKKCSARGKLLLRNKSATPYTNLIQDVNTKDYREN